MNDRASLEARWLDLTRRALPGLADARGWPAVALGEAAIAGAVDMGDLDRRSLDWRGKAPSKPRAAAPISPASQSGRTKIERTA